MMRKMFLALGMVCLLANAGKASIVVQGSGPLGSYTATLNYTATNATNGSLDVSIKNTSATVGYLVAFLFNNPGDAITGVSLGVNDTNLATILGGASYQNLIKAAPFGNFDIGVSLGGNNNNGFEGAGGSPIPGIAQGVTGNFRFDFVGAGLNALTTQSFVNALNEDDEEFFIARFKGFANGGSDKVPGDEVVVPEPMSLMVWGTLALGALAYRRCRG